MQEQTEAGLKGDMSKTEYVRQGGSWELILENLKHIQQTTTHYINFQCIFNILSFFVISNSGPFGGGDFNR